MNEELGKLKEYIENLREVKEMNFHIEHYKDDEGIRATTRGFLNACDLILMKIERVNHE